MKQLLGLEKTFSFPYRKFLMDKDWDGLKAIGAEFASKIDGIYSD